LPVLPLLGFFLLCAPLPTSLHAFLSRDLRLLGKTLPKASLGTSSRFLSTSMHCPHAVSQAYCILLPAMGFAGFPALAPGPELLPVHRLRLQSPFPPTRASRPSKFSPHQQPIRVTASLGPLAVESPSTHRSEKLHPNEHPRLQGVSPLMSPFWLLHIAAAAPIGTPMGLFPLQGLPDFRVGHPPFQTHIPALPRPRKACPRSR